MAQKWCDRLPLRRTTVALRRTDTGGERRRIFEARLLAAPRAASAPRQRRRTHPEIPQFMKAYTATPKVEGHTRSEEVHRRHGRQRMRRFVAGAAGH